MRRLHCLHYNLFFKPLQKCRFQSNALFVKIKDEVASALSKQQPVVALESTIITHGLPYPSNLNTALSVENTVRKFGAIPATIGILDGELLVGMSHEELKYLAETKNTIKTSRRDLSYVISKKLDGGTTVSATMLAASIAGIDVFVTGGIGGVHRGAHETFDISADLMELSQTPVAVVCAGVKSILDIGLTLEYLETQGVPVITFGESKCFPAFFSPISKFDAPYNSASVSEIAQIINNQKLMNMTNGLVLGVPIPVEDGNKFDEMEEVIENALEEAKSLGISGKNITPFVLAKIVELTAGDSLISNIKLIENNAKIGAQISCELSKLRSMKNGKNIKVNFVKSEKSSKKPKRPLVIGGSIFDIKATVDSISKIPEETNLGKLHTSFGGVGRNIAECLSRMGADPFLISSVGKDHQGEMILTNMTNLGMDTRGIFISDLPTASYSIVADQSGELIMAVGDMENHDGVSPETLKNFEEDIKEAGIVVLDGNISTSTLRTALELCSQYNTPTWFDPTTVGRSVRPFLNKDVNITYISPNIEELRAINGVLHKTNESLISKTIIKDEIIKECLRLSPNFFNNVDNLVITLGKKGVLVVSKKSPDSIFSSGRHQCTDDFSVIHYPPASKTLLPVPVKSVSGAGDSFASGVIYGYLHGYDTDTCVKGGLLAAYKSLNTYVAISHEISPELMQYDVIHSWAHFKGDILLP